MSSPTMRLFMATLYLLGLSHIIVEPAVTDIMSIIVVCDVSVRSTANYNCRSTEIFWHNPPIFVKYGRLWESGLVLKQAHIH